MAEFISRIVGGFILAIITVYRYTLSPLLGPRCRFEPSCSLYASEAVSRFGAFRGSWLAIKRIGKCHPWHEGGYDPVPPACSSTTAGDE